MEISHGQGFKKLQYSVFKKKGQAFGAEHNSIILEAMDVDRFMSKL